MCFTFCCQIHPGHNDMMSNSIVHTTIYIRNPIINIMQLTVLVLACKCSPFCTYGLAFLLSLKPSLCPLKVISKILARPVQGPLMFPNLWPGPGPGPAQPMARWASPAHGEHWCTQPHFSAGQTEHDICTLSTISVMVRVDSKSRLRTTHSISHYTYTVQYESWYV